MSAPAGRRPGKGRHFDSLEQEVFLNLWRTYDRLRLLEEELFGEHDLTPQQYNVLRLLRGVFPGKHRTLVLASKLVSRAPDITRMLDKLEQRGLIDRDRLADNRRVVEVGITEAGLAMLAELDVQVRQCHSRQLGHMARDQLQQLAALLRTAREPHEDPASPWR
jgi:DNA-binding MarR family transcriptional regulator